MIDPTPSVNCQYGAPMGRRDHGARGDDTPHKFSLQRVPLDSGGYDRGGAYWGIGEPLFYAGNNDIDRYFRAKSRDHAKQIVREEFPNATFYR